MDRAARIEAILAHAEADQARHKAREARIRPDYMHTVIRRAAEKAERAHDLGTGTVTIKVYDC